MSLKSRLQKLRQKFAEQEIDAVLISQPENRYYLSGFDGSAGWLLVTPQQAVLAVDFRYVEQAKAQAPGCEIFRTADDISRWFPELIGGLRLRRLGIEAGHVTMALYRQLDEVAKPLELALVTGMVESLRMVKEPEEIGLITSAVAISDGALEYIRSIIHTGMSERAVAWEIEKFMRGRGSQAIPFEVIVASGPNAALPHAKPSPRTIRTGEPVVIDIGARAGGYCSDLTRTLCLGDGDKTFSKVYSVVLNAQLTAIAAIKPGITGEEVDSSARGVIEQAGYSEAFGHSFGHGIGLVPHEPPRLGPGSQERLADGMVFTVEPGIYLTGWGGVRIEDTAVMEGGKIRVLSTAGK